MNSKDCNVKAIRSQSQGDRGDRYRAEIYAVNGFLKKYENEKFEALKRQMAGLNVHKLYESEFYSDDSSVELSSNNRTDVLKSKPVNRKINKSVGCIGAV